MRDRLAPALLLLSVVFVPGSAGADADFAPESSAWNGLSRFMALARQTGTEVLAPDRIELPAFSPDNALIIIHPSRLLPAAGLTAFMQRGGRLALVDDFGQGKGLLHAYEIGRHAPPLPDVPRLLRGNKHLPVATSESGHPLTEGVTALVANHTQVVYHRKLAPVFSFDPHRKNALVLAGAVGEGRFIVVADSSLLINNMLEFRGNRAFSRNLVQYLTDGGKRKLFVISGDTPVVASGRATGFGNPFRAIRQGLRHIADLELPPATIRALAVFLMAIMLFSAATAFPRRSPYVARADMLTRPATVAGYAGRVWFFKQGGRNLLHPLLAYKFEFEAALIQRLQLPERPLLRDAVQRMRSLKIPETHVDALRGLLNELHDLYARQDLPPSPPKVDQNMFHRMVTSGQRILNAIDEKAKTT